MKKEHNCSVTVVCSKTFRVHSLQIGGVPSKDLKFAAGMTWKIGTAGLNVSLSSVKHRRWSDLSGYIAKRETKQLQDSSFFGNFRG